MPSCRVERRDIGNEHSQGDPTSRSGRSSEGPGPPDHPEYNTWVTPIRTGNATHKRSSCQSWTALERAQHLLRQQAGRPPRTARGNEGYLAVAERR